MEKYKGKIPSYKIDLILRLLFMPSAIYYSVDTHYYFSLYPDISICVVAYLIHHFVTLGAAYDVLTFPYYPWWFIGPFMLHAWMMAYPGVSILKYIYMTNVIYTFYRYNLEPYKSDRKY